MNKTTKGALAAGAAAVLLMGGAGTLAYWSDSADVDGGTIEAGELKLDAGSCDANWVHADESTVSIIVPGDIISKECTFTITAEGDNLEATLTTPGTVTYTQTAGDQNPAPTLDLDIAATYAIDGGAVSTITEANDGDTLTATLTATFAFGDAATINANDTQNLIAELDELTVTLTQDANP